MTREQMTQEIQRLREAAERHRKLVEESATVAEYHLCRSKVIGLNQRRLEAKLAALPEPDQR